MHSGNSFGGGGGWRREVALPNSYLLLAGCQDWYFCILHAEIYLQGSYRIFRKSLGKPGKVREFVAIFVRVRE